MNAQPSFLVANAMYWFGDTREHAEARVREWVDATARMFDEAFPPTCDDRPHPCPALAAERDVNGGRT